MVRVPKFVTWCTVCKKHVGVRPNWVRSQAGQSTQMRVAHHGKPICAGSGILVGPELVFPNRDDDYSPEAYNRTIEAGA